jgi:hypothetical protein
VEARLVRRYAMIHLEPNMLAEEARTRLARLWREADVERHLTFAQVDARWSPRPPTPWRVARVRS